MSKFDAAIGGMKMDLAVLREGPGTKDRAEAVAQYEAAIRVLNAAAAVDERDLGRVFMGFVSTEMRALLEAIRGAK